MTPDWSARGEAVPYATLTSPQSLNLYAYVLDNPTTGVDPDGHTNGPGHDETPPNGCGGANQPACQQSSAQVAADQTNDPPAQQKKADQAPSWDPSKPLPDNPSKLGPDWKRDPGHKAPNEERYVNDKTGDKLDWNKGKPSGGKRWRDNPHWH